ncbi:aminotransferase class V-fold PLP-dependent enzyme [Shimia sp. CNT1-13L.2]|uniref:pyridoxal phosphate-dependent decarboxylase family protein n=1 Tax=Shimia sp. CNT1-13L.2 TaxID=2959663 RepID=UPI0020CF2533|nr:aminotransferase class V-fold PLP-dependent enzyme [Shimia sp. CNT1-13L.2]MCP9480593.1 aminotransferase class V-fold PLP-dependent enzyme [Shimia sp. CNT1-13L.2]
MHGRDALFPNLDQLMDAENALTERLNQARRDYASRSATSAELTPDWLVELKSKRFEQSEDLEPLMDWVIDALDTGSVQMTHPGYLGLFNPAPTFAAECADRIASMFNPQICVYSHAPAAVEIEQHVINEVARRAGLPKRSGGHFTSGGAEANSTAVLCALQAKCPEYSDKGIYAFGGQPTIYVSKESHLAWLKMAHSAGIGRNAVRLIATDGQGQMDVDCLAVAIDEDLKNGCVPVLIVATAGTTNAGMIDPLKPCGALAQKHGMWFHVDAAWGGAMITSKAGRSVLDGIQQADSITIDAHKWFATTMGAGMFLTSRPDIPAQVFRISASYMPESEAAKDFYVNSNQWSRRFVGLRLFLSLGAAGWDGYADHVERSIRLTNRFTENLKKAGWSQANRSLMGVSCMVPPEGHDSVQGYVDTVHADGRFWVSKALFEGKPVLRACVTNGRTNEATIDQLTEFLTSA